jgi:hypothetical protein
VLPETRWSRRAHLRIHISSVLSMSKCCLHRPFTYTITNAYCSYLKEQYRRRVHIVSIRQPVTASEARHDGSATDVTERRSSISPPRDRFVADSMKGTVLSRAVTGAECDSSPLRVVGVGRSDNRKESKRRSAKKGSSTLGWAIYHLTASHLPRATTRG